MDNLKGFYDEIKSPDLLFAEAALNRVQGHLEEFFLNYRRLHAQALELDVRRWHEVPFSPPFPHMPPRTAIKK